jgi:eukaryotic-like serine/threonine-protein kinase
MPLARGALLGPYRVDAEIGAGGMGHVFRATDTRLDRAVAIKILPEHRWSDPNLRHRFEREARALSSLSHPNLCSLYDIGEVEQSGGSTPYLVMELLEGETLRDRLQTGPIGMRKALMWAAQIAHGLAAAHQKGVIHRDLKPENVFITQGELLKILDFGLAITEQLGTDASTLVRTQPGMVMGTAHYMSPEQVRGTTLDARSDIFSLGIVLFEMLTGEVPFHARSPVETMNAILVDEPPDIGALVSPIPEAVEELVWRCLEKDPARRFSSAGDLAFALESAAKSVTSATPVPVRRRSSAPRAIPQTGNRHRTRAIILGVMAIGIAAAAVFSRGTFDQPEPEPPRLRTLTYSGRDGSPAASPDGRLIAFVSTRDGRRRIWLKQLADGTEVAITSGPEDSAPRFAPDGSVLLFTRTENVASAIYRVPVVGGEPRKLIDNAFDGDWSPDGKQLAFIRTRGERNARTSTLCIAPINGGAVQEIAMSTTEELIFPRWSPRGNAIVVSRAPRGTAAGSLLVIDPTSGDQQVIKRDVPHGLLSGAAWVAGGDALVYAELDALAGGLPGRGRSSTIVLHEVGSGRARVLLRNPHSSADSLDVTGAGHLVFSEDFTRQSLREVSLDGSGHERWLSRGISVDRQPSYARGGNSIVFTSDRAGSLDIWELLLDSGSLRRITDHEGIDWDPFPSADGKSLFWSSDRSGHFEIWTSAFDGGNPQQATQDGVDAENPSLPAAGDWIFYDSSNPSRDALQRIPRNGGRPVLVVQAETAHPEVSADGAYAVYGRPEGGGPIAIDIVRVADGTIFPMARGLTGVSSVRARWIGATHTIAFRTREADGAISIYTQEFRPGVDTTATRRLLVSTDADAPVETFAIAPDGKHAVLAIVDEASGLMMAEGVEGITK